MLDIRKLDTEYNSALVKLADAAESEAHKALLARLLWSIIAEPADTVAGKLITEFGAVESLAMLLQAMNSKSEAAKLRKAYATNCAENGSVAAINAALKRWEVRATADNLDAELRQTLRSALQRKLQVLIPEKSNWPTQINDLGEATPYLLWVAGDPQLLSGQTIAVVGSRAASHYGEFVTEHFVGELNRYQQTIISGAAYGIDAVAHKTALNIGGKTIAVLAGGVERPYPAGNTRLLQQVSESNGAVITEMPPYAAPTRWRFLQRNRIIAALATGTLVTEAAIRSGSINTAGHAAQLGRNLGAVPGNISSNYSAGCHKLLREYGAELVYDTESLIEAFELSTPEIPMQCATANQVVAEASAEREKSVHTRVLDALPLRGAASVNKIAAKAGIGVGECEMALSELQLLGKIYATQGAQSILWKLQH